MSTGFSFTTTQVSSTSGYVQNEATTGDWALYDNIGTLPDGTVVQGKITIIANTDGIPITLDDQVDNDLPLHLNRGTASDPSFAGSEVKFRLEFFDQTTGDPLNVSGYVTFVDLDGFAGTGNQEVLKLNTDQFSLVEVSNDTELTTSVADGTFTAVAPASSSTVIEEQHWVTANFELSKSIEFTLSAKDGATGYSLGAGDLTSPVIAAVGDPVDTDGDGINDKDDLDDDNDGILDTDEGLKDLTTSVASIYDGALTSGQVTFGITTVDQNGNGASAAESADKHILDSITVNGETFTDFVVPTKFTSFHNVGQPDDPQTAYFVDNGVSFSGTYNYTTPNFDENILTDAFQSRDLGEYLSSDNGIDSTDHYILEYEIPIVSTAGGFVAVTERNGNNPLKLEALDADGNTLGTIEVQTSDYIDTGHNVHYSGTQNAHIALYAVDDLASLGEYIHAIKITYGDGMPNDGPDGKVFFFGDVDRILAYRDTDGDGIFDHLDLDSDNDGISDIEESGADRATLDADQNGVIDGAAFVDADNDGLADAIEAENGPNQGTALRDTDSDGVDDVIDLDSDNDAISDFIEGQTTAGYQPGDGDLRNNDADGDGVVDLFDSNDGTTALFGGSFATPVNTDGGGDGADYIDINADNDTGNDSVESGLGAPGADTDGDGISDHVGVSYANPGGGITTPLTQLTNSDSDASDADYRSVNNLAPNASNDNATTAEDTFIVIDVLTNDTDPDMGALSVTGTTPPSNGSIVVNPDGTITYTPDPGFTGNDSFTYTISDPQGATDTATVTLVIDPAPDAVDDTEVTPVDTPVAIAVLGNDSDDDPLSITGTTPPSNGSIVVNPDGTITYTPDPGFTGTDSFTYTLTDPQGSTDTATVTVTVDPAPDAVDDTEVTPVDTPVAIAVLGNDNDDDPLSITGTTPPSNGSIVVNPDGTITYTPDPGFTGTDSFTYTLTDPQGSTDTATVTVTVDPSVDALDDTRIAPQDTTVTIPVLANDTAITPLTIIGTSDPANGTVVINPDGTISYTPDAGFTGTDTFTYTVTDPEGETDTALVTVTVRPPTDGTVDGSGGDDLIDGTYTGDPDGDQVDNDDSQVPGNPDNDNINAGDGNDTVLSGDGDDTVDGGTGDDVIRAAAGNDLVNGGAGNDVIDAGDTAPLPDDGFGTVTPEDPDPTNDLDTVSGGDGNDSISTGDDADQITGDAGFDTLDGGLDDDTVSGGDDNDLIIGGEGSDSLFGDAGDDTIYGDLNDPTWDVLDATDPELDNGDDYIEGGTGNDLVFGEDDNDTLLGGAGNDTLDGGIDNDALQGDDGNDSLIGGEGDDFLLGGNGADTLDGGTGADILQGDADQDTFVNVGVGDVVSGGETTSSGLPADDFDTLDLTGSVQFGAVTGSLVINYLTPDRENGTVTFRDENGANLGTLSFTGIENIVPCFAAGTLISTARGEIAVEKLVPGDLVMTLDHGYQPVRWAGQTTVVAEGALAPVEFAPGTIGNDRLLRLSPQHRVLVQSAEAEMLYGTAEVLVPALSLINGQTIRQVQGSTVTYVHLLFDRHEIILSDGARTESFLPGARVLTAMDQTVQDEIYQLFPELRDATQSAYASARPLVTAQEGSALAA